MGLPPLGRADGGQSFALPSGGIYGTTQAGGPELLPPPVAHGGTRFPAAALDETDPGSAPFLGVKQIIMRAVARSARGTRLHPSGGGADRPPRRDALHLSQTHLRH